MGLNHVRLPRPPWYPQINRWTCWAAALQSWLAVVGGGRPRLTQRQILKHRAWKDHLERSGAIWPVPFARAVAEHADIRMQWNIWSGRRPGQGKEARPNQVRHPCKPGYPDFPHNIPATVHSKLVRCRHVFVCYPVTVSLVPLVRGYHCGVLWGMQPRKPKDPDPYVYLLDPDPRQGYRPKRLSTLVGNRFAHGNYFFVGWAARRGHQARRRKGSGRR